VGRLTLTAQPEAGRAASRQAPGAARFRGLDLATDLRFRLFAALFALGLINHELQFILEQQRYGPFLQYLEILRPARTTIDWPSSVGVGLHLADLLVGVLVLLRPDRGCFALLGLTFPVTLLVSPDRVASHCSLMAAAAVVVLLLGLGEAVEVALRPAARAAARVGWLRWSRLSLVAFCLLTYAFAGLNKLNTQWLSPAESDVRDFVIAPIRLLGLPLEPSLGLLLAPAMYGTIAVELGLALLLPWRRAAPFAILLGLLFHLPMLAQGVGDFPTVILAFYPLFLSEQQAAELVARYRSRPSPQRLALTLGLVALGIVSIHRAHQPRELHALSLDSTPLLNVVHLTLLDLTLVLFAWVTPVVAAWLVERCLGLLGGGALPARHAFGR
jgi:hypothetical protein